MNTKIKAVYKEKTGKSDIGLIGNPGEMVILTVHIIEGIANITGKTKYEVMKDITCSIRVAEERDEKDE